MTTAKMKRELKFNKGDLVKLKTGKSPVMVIDKINNNDEGVTYTCKWFAGSKLEYGHFSEESLVASDEGTTVGNTSTNE